MVFVGFDNEENPTKGGVYRARLQPDPRLQVLVKIGDKVKDFKGKELYVPGTRTPYRFTRFGEGLSFDGRYVAFWAAWGSETRTIELTCPADGNKAVIAYCMGQSVVDAERYAHGQVPRDRPGESGPLRLRHAGGKVVDDRAHRRLLQGLPLLELLRPPAWNRGGGRQGGEDTLEPPRWRSNAFSAVNAPLSDGSYYRLAYKAVRPDGAVGIYMAAGPETKESAFKVVVDTQTSARALDPELSGRRRVRDPAHRDVGGAGAGCLPQQQPGEGLELPRRQREHGGRRCHGECAGVYLTRMSNKR